jgi:triphosphatase
MATEVELKLTAHAGALAATLDHPALRALQSAQPQTAELVSTYFDTPSGELRRRGVSLRIRNAGNAWVQTVKGGGSAASGLHVRAEYEWQLAAPRIDAAKLAETPWSGDFAATTGRRRAIFRTLIGRTEIPVAFADGTRAVVCLDAGAIRAARKRIAVSELEIELVEGNVARLYELALALVADLPFSVATASKADRGFALAWSTPRRPLRATRVALAHGISVNDALAALGAECLAHIGTNAEAVADGTDDEFLHQLRVGVRRLRSLLRIVARVSSADVVATLNDELRWLSGLLGPARDWDVFATDTLAALAAHVAHPGQRRELGRLRARVTRVRRVQRRAAIEAVASRRFAMLMLSAGRLFLTLHDTASVDAAQAHDARTLARTMLDRRDRALRKRGRHLSRATAAERHATRIAAKKLRYAAEFFAPLFSQRRAQNYVKSLARLQAVLGRLNDLATAKRLVDELAVPGATLPSLEHAAGMARGWIAASEQFALLQVDKAWNRSTKLKSFWD